MNYDPILIDDKEKKERIEERKNDLKHFMKKKKNEQITHTPNQAKGDIIWMKGMDDVVNLNTNENQDEQKKNINVSILNDNSDDDTKNKKEKRHKDSDYSAKKDKEDFVDCHKMYLDLDNIEKELGETDEFESKQEYYNVNDNDINKDTRDFNIVIIKLYRFINFSQLKFFYFFYRRIMKKVI